MKKTVNGTLLSERINSNRLYIFDVALCPIFQHERKRLRKHSDVLIRRWRKADEKQHKPKTDDKITCSCTLISISITISSVSNFTIQIQYL